MSTPVDKADDPNYLKADKYDSLDKDSGLRAKLASMFTDEGEHFEEKLDQIMELVQQSNVEVAEQATEALLFNGNTVYWKGKGYNITLKEEQHE